METQPNGSLRFRRKEKPFLVFVFRRENYERHCEKRGQLKDKLYLKELEKTFDNPDVITEGPEGNKRTFYRVLENIHNKYNIWVRVIQVPVFQDIKNKQLYFIATTYDFWGYADEVIHSIEKRRWDRPNVLI